jgi:hypothetical protein
VKRYTAISLERFRADAATCRAYGLKVGSTGTTWLVRDEQTGLEGRVTSYGATPGERKTAAIHQFAAGHCDGGAKPVVPPTSAELKARTDRAIAEINAFLDAADRGDL